MVQVVAFKLQVRQGEVQAWHIAVAELAKVLEGHVVKQAPLLQKLGVLQERQLWGPAAEQVVQETSQLEHAVPLANPLSEVHWAWEMQDPACKR